VGIILSFAAGCAPPSISPEEMAPAECVPANLTIQPGDGRLDLKWETNCPPDRLISGYFIYLENEPIPDKYLRTHPPKSIRPFNLAAYPGDTDPESSYETMTIENLDNGIDYFITVRTAFPDNSLSAASNQVRIMCRPQGEFALAVRYAATNDGFSFASGQSVRADGESNDLYFYYKDGFDFLASPHRLNGFLRESKFYSLGKTENVDQYPELELDFEPVEKIPIMVGESYIVKTHDNRYAKCRIEKITGEENKGRVLHISYIYQTVEKLMRF
jgi:hypothetical protein